MKNIWFTYQQSWLSIFYHFLKSLLFIKADSVSVNWMYFSNALAIGKITMCSALLSNQIKSIVPKILFKVWKPFPMELVKKLLLGIQNFSYVSSKNPEVFVTMSCVLLFSTIRDHVLFKYLSSLPPPPKDGPCQRLSREILTSCCHILSMNLKNLSDFELVILC